MRPLHLILLLVLMSACARSVTRMDPGEAVDLSGRWNDTDSRQVANAMIQNLLNSDKFKDYTSKLGRKPAIIVGLVRNRTSEHIDTEAYIKRIELALFNSGVAEVVESGAFRDKLRVERVNQRDFAKASTVAQWGEETGANLMLFGEMTSETDVYQKQRVVNYITTLFLTDMETNKRVWYGQEEIKKYVKN